MQMVCYIEEEKNANRSNLIDIRVFKSITRNSTKRFKWQKKICKLTKNAKTIKATLKIIANQEFQAKKRKIEI